MRTLLLVAACAALGTGCGAAAARRVAVVPPAVVRYEQTYELSGDDVDGARQNDLRVVQSTAVEFFDRRPDGSYDVAVRVGRVRVWVGDLGGPPAIDTLEHGAETADRAYEDGDAGVAALLAALWLPMVETRATLHIDERGGVRARTEDALVGERLDGNAAEHLGTALLEGAVRTSSLALCALADGDRWTAALPLRLDPWGVRLDVPLAVEADGHRLAFRGAPPVPVDVGPLRVERAVVTGAARLGTDGLPDEASWTLEIAATTPGGAGDARGAQSATLRYVQRRIDAAGE